LKILFLCYGHFDSGIELFKKLSNIIETTLVVQVEGDELIQSDMNVDIRDIPLGLHHSEIRRFQLIKEIEKLFEIAPVKICVLKYNSLSLRDIKNFVISKKFVTWVKSEGFTHIHYYGSSLTWVQQLLFLHGIKRIYTVHDYMPHSGEVKNGSGYQYKFYMRIITLLKSNRFLLLSKKMMGEFSEYYGVPKGNSWFVLFGSFDSYKKFNIIKFNKESYSIIFFGRISRYKGIEYLIEATKLVRKEIPQIKTIVAGGGEFYFDINDIKNDPHFEIHNYHISNEQLAEFISRCSVVVCPYTDATQSGVVMTAYAFNKPVIATDVGSFREYVLNGETGIIVPPKNSEALAGAIKKLLLDETLRKNMVKNIEEKKETAFSWESSAKKLIQIYNEIQ